MELVQATTASCERPTAKNPQGRTGTYAGYQQHLKLREPACDACRTANTVRNRTSFKPDGYMREYAAANRERLGAYNRGRRDRRQDLLDELKAVPCADCQGTFPSVCMDFDHVRGEKKFSISRASTRSTKTVLEEISKCEVVCANCHRIRTAARAELLRKYPRSAA